MKHRHLNHQGFTLAAIDDIISRGDGNDWIELGLELKRNPSIIIPKIIKISEHRLKDPYEQRYYFWNSYAKEKAKEQHVYGTAMHARSLLDNLLK